MPDQQPAREKWHALWTRSNCERLVHDALQAKGFEVFLPQVGVWCRRAGRRQLGPAPMFPGYLFLRRAMDKVSYIEVNKAKGLVAILGEQWDRLAVVPDPDIAAIQQALRADLPVLPHPYLGRRPAGPDRARSDMLHRSVAVEVDCTSWRRRSRVGDDHAIVTTRTR